MTTCEDCGEDTKRRKKCPKCGLRICGWCWNHVHALNLQLTKHTGAFFNKVVRKETQ